MVIDEARTLEIFGHTSDELKPQSHKPIVVVCEGCGRHRVVPKDRWHTKTDWVKQLCQPCARKEKWNDPEYCERMSLAQTKRYEDPEEHVKTSKAIKKAYKDPKLRLRERKSASNKMLWADPIKREKMLTGCKKAWTNPGRRDQACARMTNRYEDPIELEKLSAAVQGISYDEWEGFAQDHPYCPKFNGACRESNREKYDRCCFLSGTTETENGQKLSVHHYDMNKEQGCIGHTWKLVPLCRKWHSKSHSPTWTARIVYLLNHVWTTGRNNVVS